MSGSTTSQSGFRHGCPLPCSGLKGLLRADRNVKTTWGAIHEKALPEFTRLFPSIYRILFGLRATGQTGDARSEISKDDGSNPVFGPGSSAGHRCGNSAAPAPKEGRSRQKYPCGKAVEPAKKPTAKNSRPQMALRPREASLEDAHNPISPIRSTGSLPLRSTVPDEETPGLNHRKTCPSRS